MILSPLVESWIGFKSIAQPSPHSVRARRGDLVAIASILRRRVGLSGAPDDPFDGLTTAHLTPDHLVAAFAEFAGDHSSATMRRVRSTWNGLCGWLVTHRQVLDSNPMQWVEGPRSKAWQPKPVSEEDLRRVVRAAGTADPAARRQWPALERAVCAVLVTTGIRRSELCRLRVGDLHRSRDGLDLLRVLGKGNKMRSVPLPPEAVSILDAYLADRAARLEEAPGATDPMFVRADGRPMNGDALYRMVLGWFRRAGVAPPPQAVVHALRHTAATGMLGAGASVPELATLLGHASIATTQVYLEVAARGVEEAAMSNPARRMLAEEDD